MRLLQGKFYFKGTGITCDAFMWQHNGKRAGGCGNCAYGNGQHMTRLHLSFRSLRLSDSICRFASFRMRPVDFERSRDGDLKRMGWNLRLLKSAYSLFALNRNDRVLRPIEMSV